MKKGSRIGNLTVEGNISTSQIAVTGQGSLLAATERGMLEDMRHTRSIWRIRFEAYPKDIILIVLCHVHIIRICPVML